MKKPEHPNTCACSVCLAYWKGQQPDKEKLVRFLEKGDGKPMDPEKSNFEKLKAAVEKHPPDPVNHPKHYTSHPSGIEVIQITEHENFCRGNAIKYLLRAGKKGSEIEDLQKAAWYINREILRVQAMSKALSQGE
jgi:hypothetical protein